MPALAWLVVAYLLGSVPSALIAGRWVEGDRSPQVRLGQSRRDERLSRARRARGGRGARVRHREGRRAGALLPALDHAARRRRGGRSRTASRRSSGTSGRSISAGAGAGRGSRRRPGVFVALAPMPMLLAIAVWLAVVSLTRYVSLASLTAALHAARRGRDLERRRAIRSSLGAAAVAAFVCWTHRANLVRLRRGIEPRIGRPGRMTRCAVVGAGAWGTALADLLARNGHAVSLWALRAGRRRERQRAPRERALLARRAAARRRDAPPATSATRCAAPSSCSSWRRRTCCARVARQAAPGVEPTDAVLVVATKGIERETLALMTDVIAQEIPGHAGRGALGAELRRRGRGAAADGGRRGGDARARRRRARSGRSRSDTLPRLHERRRDRRRARRRAQERDRGGDRHRRGARPRLQSARRAHHARARRDDAARRRARRVAARPSPGSRGWATSC